MTPRRPWLLAATLLVAACGVAATAHGLYAVAAASGVPWLIACAYPVIGDGLAIVAYVAAREREETLYPWAVVVVAAGLSGIAQGWYLASLGDPPPELWSAEWWLRFGVGMAPAVAVLAVVHLLWLVSRNVREAASDLHLAPEIEGLPSTTSQQPPGQEPYPRPGPAPPTVSANGNGHGHGGRRVSPERVAATNAAVAYHAEHGAWPTQTRLRELTRPTVAVSNGLAGKVLQELKASHAPLVPMRRDA